MLDKSDKGLIGLLVLAIVVIILVYALVPEFNATPLIPHRHVLDDMRSIATALETYWLDNGAYPPAVPDARTGTVISPVLTTPIHYLMTLPPHRYATDGSSAWIMYHPGPDEVWDITSPEQFLDEWQRPGAFSEELLNVTFDPTNGATSRGDVWRLKD